MNKATLFACETALQVTYSFYYMGDYSYTNGHSKKTVDFLLARLYNI